jgi:hypothetical protein
MLRPGLPHYRAGFLGSRRPNVVPWRARTTVRRHSWALCSCLKNRPIFLRHRPPHGETIRAIPFVALFLPQTQLP